MQKSNESVSNYSKAGERNMIKKSLIAFGIIILLIGITGGSVYMADRVFTPSTNEVNPYGVDKQDDADN